MPKLKRSLGHCRDNILGLWVWTKGLSWSVHEGKQVHSLDQKGYKTEMNKGHFLFIVISAIHVRYSEIHHESHHRAILVRNMP